MVLVKILMRRDASSVVVAILIALILSQPISEITSPLAGHITMLKDGQYYGSAPPNSGYKFYLYLVVWAILQFVVLELLSRLYVGLRVSTKKK
jgi:hypothetical protein